MVQSRSLTRSVGNQRGYTQNGLGDVIEVGSWLSPVDHLEDTIGGYPDPYPLFIQHDIHVPSTITGHDVAFSVYWYTDMPMFDSIEDGGVRELHVESEPSIASAVTSVEAATNPSRPDVSVPNFLYELKDLPEMLHKKGSAHAAKRHSNSTVENNFGWQLLFQDLSKMIDFTASVNKRVTELKRLHSKKGLKRRRTVYSSSASVEFSRYFHSVQVSVTGPVKVFQQIKSWVTVRWIPDSPSMPSADDLVRLARTTVHGWDGSSNGLAAIIWEAIPWSWMADYFGNMGSYLDAHRNAVGASAANACYMRQINTNWSYGPFDVSSPDAYVCTAGSHKTVTKERFLGLASLTVSLPFLSKKQLSTLSSIAFNLGRK